MAREGTPAAGAAANTANTATQAPGATGAGTTATATAADAPSGPVRGGASSQPAGEAQGAPVDAVPTAGGEVVSEERVSAEDAPLEAWAEDVTVAKSAGAGDLTDARKQALAEARLREQNPDKVVYRRRGEDSETSEDSADEG